MSTGPFMWTSLLVHVWSKVVSVIRDYSNPCGGFITVGLHLYIGFITVLLLYTCISALLRFYYCTHIYWTHYRFITVHLYIGFITVLLLYTCISDSLRFYYCTPVSDQLRHLLYHHVCKVSAQVQVPIQCYLWGKQSYNRRNLPGSPHSLYSLAVCGL